MGQINRIRAPGSVAAALSMLLLVAACTMRLAPAYDQSIADGLVSTNRDVQVLFAALGPGVTKDSYPGRADTYARLEGSLNALEIQVKARPLPPDAATLPDANAMLAKMGIGAIAGDDPAFTAFPSARAIHDASATLAKMQQVDAERGLRGDLVQAFANQEKVYLTQAIAYESFLKR